MIIYTI